MCAGAHYWAGIGRLVFALSGAQLAAIVPPGGPALDLSCREVFARGNVGIEVDGPCPELVDEALALFDGLWAPSATPDGGEVGPASPWSAFAAAEPELAAFAADRLRAAPGYLATVRADGSATGPSGHARRHRGRAVRLHGAHLPQGPRPPGTAVVRAPQRGPGHERHRRRGVRDADGASRSTTPTSAPPWPPPRPTTRPTATCCSSCWSPTCGPTATAMWPCPSAAAGRAAADAPLSWRGRRRARRGSAPTPGRVRAAGGCSCRGEGAGCRG